ncbi:MAG: RAD52 family DNA repair protein [Rhodosalinus sp.]
MDWDAAKPLLEAKLDPAKVRKPEGRYGPKGDWIEGWHAIAEANRIFGHGAWSYEIKSLTRDVLEQGTTSKGEPQWVAAYSCIVRLDVAGTVREDVGFGSGYAKQAPDAIEGATKEAVTDALKRALRTFGWPFGLALYDKQRAHVGVTPPPPPPPEETRDRIKAAIARAQDEAALDKVLGHPATKDAIATLPHEMQGDVLRAADEARGRIAGNAQAPQGDHAYG